MKRRDIIKLGLVAAMAGSSVALAPQSFAGSDPIYTSFLSDKALSGFDAVSFHTGEPVKGDPKFYYDYKGAVFIFKDKANRNQFIADPEKYAPAYGGYCAWAVSQGKLAPGKPEYWTIRDGKLYVNFNGRIQQRWEKDPDGFIELAEQEWPKLIE